MPSSVEVSLKSANEAILWNRLIWHPALTGLCARGEQRRHHEVTRQTVPLSDSTKSSPRARTTAAGESTASKCSVMRGADDSLGEVKSEGIDHTRPLQ